jgi:CheY-like chemotaxis protein
MKPEVLNLNTVLEDLRKMLGRLIGEDTELVVVPGPDLGSIKADRGQLEQVIVNLTVNARDAMPNGGTLTLEARNTDLDELFAESHPSVVPGHHVMLAVSDTGSGMDEVTRLKIFEPFFTTKGQGKGTGLGLSTVYGIVKQSGGSIWVYSEVGKGSTFKIYLPRVDGMAGASRPAQPTTALHGTETILVVEDAEPLLRLAARILQSVGYTVLTASNGGEALLVLERHEGPVQLMLTDVVMPRMSGRDLAERLRSAHPEMKVLYTSGYTDDAIVHHGVLDEGVAFIVKPYTVADLTQKVRAVLDQQE